MVKAILYTTNTCIHCNTAKSLLKSKGYDVDVRVIGVTHTKENFETDCPGARVVPQTIIEGVVYSGINPLKEFLA